MSQLSRRLTPGENLVYTAKLHWIMYVGTVITALILFAAFYAIDYFKLYQVLPREIWIHKSKFYAVLISIFVAWPLFKTSLIRLTTCIGITDQRLILKRGIIAINLNSMPLVKIENTDADQGILERILGYGTVVVKGSGSTPISIKCIAKPIQFRDKLVSLIPTNERDVS